MNYVPQDKTPGRVHSDLARFLLPTSLHQHPSNDRIHWLHHTSDSVAQIHCVS